MRVPWSDGEWRRVAVFGLGLSGLAAVRLLLAQGVRVVAIDGRADPDLGDLENADHVEWLLGDDHVPLPEGVDGVVLSPGIPGDRPLLQQARTRGLPVVAEVELAFAFLEGPLVAVTGSNGKSTTTAMTAAILSAAGVQTELCGNIGTPLSSCVEGSGERTFVVELSSFQLEEVVFFRASAAALLNLSPDHLDRYADMAGYIAAKARIFERQDESCVAVLNRDDPLVVELATDLAGPRRRFFSRRQQVEDGLWLSDGEVIEACGGRNETLFTTTDVGVPGVHNLENAMAAALLARSRGIDAAAIRRGLAAFTGLPHRLEAVRTRSGVDWYDDSKGTNVGATLKSLEGFADRSVHLILGGRGKGTDPRELGETVQRKARRIYLIGETAELFERVLGGLVETENVGTLERAIELAAGAARPGEVVLLSPACASFDQFRDYRDRGQRFQALVRALDGGDHGQEAGV